MYSPLSDLELKFMARLLPEEIRDEEKAKNAKKLALEEWYRRVIND